MSDSDAKYLVLAERWSLQASQGKTDPIRASVLRQCAAQTREMVAREFPPDAGQLAQALKEVNDYVVGKSGQVYRDVRHEAVEMLYDLWTMASAYGTTSSDLAGLARVVVDALASRTMAHPSYQKDPDGQGAR